MPWAVLALIAAAFIVTSLAGGSSSKADLTYSEFVNAVDPVVPPDRLATDLLGEYHKGTDDALVLAVRYTGLTT